MTEPKDTGQYLEFLQRQAQTRRQFVGLGAGGLGAFFLHAANAKTVTEASTGLKFVRDPSTPLSVLPPQFPAKVKRIIYLHMGGAPSQLELFDHKPQLARFNGHDCPESFLKGKRFAFITGIPKMLGPQFPFHQTGRNGTWISDRLPHLEQVIDDLCIIKSMKTDQFNHAPAQLLVQTGDQRTGHASLGSWVTYGLGTENQNLPGFIVLISNGGTTANAGKPLWGSGFLPSVYQGVPCRSAGEPVLYLQNPKGVTRQERREVLDAVDEINRHTYQEFGNPETVTRIAQYEMAFRMQLEASDAMDIHREPQAVLERYGAQPGKTSYANNCLVARRLAERGVRFIQLYHWGWDSHGSPTDEGLNVGLVKQCKTTDQPTAALLADLKSRGLLEDTLVVWGGEFGRTPMQDNHAGGEETKFIGRDHHPSAFTIWMAGGGVKAGMTHGETDDMGYEIVKDPVEVRDLHATMLYLLGFDYRTFSYTYQGLDQKLTGVKPARIVSEVLA